MRQSREFRTSASVERAHPGIASMAQGDAAKGLPGHRVHDLRELKSWSLMKPLKPLPLLAFSDLTIK
jgi:hypothetical protein